MLTKESTFKELKKWFLDENGNIREDLPDTLDSDSAYYLHVKDTALLYITNIDRAFKELGAANIRKSQGAITSKNSLFKLYKALQIKESWNQPLKKLSHFNNKNK